MSSDSVTILGAGLCGSLLSIVLARRGIEVTILDQRPDPRSTEAAGGRSINLAMSARGIRGLRHAGVFDAIEPLLIPMRGRCVHEVDGSTTLHPYGQREHEVIYSVSRAALNRELVTAAISEFNVDVRFEQAAVAFHREESVLRIRNLPDANEYDVSADPLIAADGAGSVIRRAYADSNVITATEELLQHRYREFEIPAGPDGTFLMEKNALHIWPRGGFMLIALPNPGGDFTLTLFIPTEGDHSFASLDSDEKVYNFFDEQFPDATPLIKEGFRSWHNNPEGVLGTVRCNHWHDGGNVLLIGDAAHAVVPFHGQGMNLAFEDCVVLDRVIDESGTDWATVFEVFESEQIDNANAIADMALENYIEMRDTVREPNFLLRKELGFALEQRLPERFIPRYSMIMFHDEIPYAVAQQRGLVQQRLLEELTEGVEDIDQIDIDAAVALAASRLAPLH